MKGRIFQTDCKRCGRTIHASTESLKHPLGQVCSRCMTSEEKWQVNEFVMEKERERLRGRYKNPTLSVPTAREFSKFRVATKLVRSSAYRPEHGVKITSPTQVREAVSRIADAPTENLMAIYVDTKNRVNGIQLISKGERASSLVPIDHILRTAILTNSGGIVLAHNHPTDDPGLSPEDYAVARRLKQAANLVGIELLDMVVIGGSQVSSAMAEGKL